MSHDEINSLILAAIDENNHLKQSRILLDIAVEQLEKKENPDTLERIEVLLDEYISSYNCHFDELQGILRRLKKLMMLAKSPLISALK